MADGVPAGLGEPVYGKIDALLAMAMMSIPASKRCGNRLGLCRRKHERLGTQ